MTRIRLLAITLLVLHGADPARAGDDHHAAEAAHDPHHTTFSIEAFTRFGVTLASAGPGEVDIGVELPGEIRPNADRIAHLSPRFPGIVREVRRFAGDSVRAGDTLAVVEGDTLSTFEIRAAFDGTVIDKHIAPGEVVTRDETAFIVADLSTVWVVVHVYQDALPLVRVGRPVWIVAAHGALQAEGPVASVAPVVDQATRTALARVVLPNPEGAWRPGMFVTATVYDPMPVPVVVPRRAVQQVDGIPTIYVAEGDRVVPRAVTIGRSGRTRFEITAGLHPGERFVDERSFLVKAELGKGTADHDH